MHYPLPTRASHSLFAFLLSFGCLLLCDGPLRAAQPAACDNVTSPGSIAGQETGCNAAGPFDPSPLLSIVPASGGSGALQYLWMQTTTDPDGGGTVLWQPIPGSSAAGYDPGPISVTTWYTRCARRAGCVDYVAESNVIEKTVSCCDNVLAGGSIGFDQSGCGTVFPDALQDITQPTGGSGDLEFLWFSSLVGPPFVQGSPNWTSIAGADQAAYTPGAVSETTWFIRCARRSGCTEFDGESNIVRIEVRENPVLDVTAGPVSCADAADGTLDLTVTGTDAPYTYAWSNGLPAQEDQDNLAAGNYQVTVTGANGCAAVLSGQVTAPQALTAALAATQNACTIAPDTLTATVDGGTAPYTYTWSDPALTNDNVQAFLPPGTYSLTVTDDAGCTATAQAEIAAATNINLSLSVTQPDCAGNAGQIGTTLSGGQAPYSYNWSNGATSALNSDLQPGTYGLTVTDAAGCMTTAAAEIDAVAVLDLTLDSRNISCAGQVDGSVSAVIGNGEAPFTYAWSNGATTADLSNLPAGDYAVTVTDATGCSNTTAAVISAPGALQILLTPVSPTCAGATDGSVSVTNVSGGTFPFTYTWNVPATGNGSVLGNLGAGTYTLTVTDANGCTEVAEATLDAAPALELLANQTDISCKGAADGSIMVTDILNGSAPYAYAWGNGETTAGLTDLFEGTYSLTVTDANGCSRTELYSIAEPDALKLTITAQNASCVALNDGGISADASGGTAPYTFLWSNGVTTAGMTGLAPGAYSLTVTDANGCTVTDGAQIDAISDIEVAVTAVGLTCHDSADGSIDLAVSGGVGAYTILWSDGSSALTRSDLSGGVYSVTVTDDNACSVSESIIVAAPLALQVALSTSNVICPEDTNGSVNVSVAGGTPGYTFLWNDGSTGTSLTGLGVGNYAVTVTDANNCSEAAVISVAATTTLAVSPTATNVACNGEDSGTAVANASGGLTPYAYVWNTGATTPTLPNASAGTYLVTVTDAAGCSATGSTTVSEPAALVCKAQPLGLVTTHNGNQGSIEVESSGGVAPYAYAWNNGATTAVVGALPAGSYTVTVTDANGCMCTGSVILYNPSIVGDFVWNDIDEDGKQDNGEPGILGVSVNITGTDAGGLVDRTVTTDNAGAYHFDGLLPGSYKLTFTPPTNYQFTLQDQGGDNSVDSDVDPATGMTTVFTLQYDQEIPTYDAGLILLDNLISLGDYAFYDTDRDGRQDTGEGGVAGVGVTLYRADDSYVGQQTTDQNGYYLFPDLVPGDYYVVFSLANLDGYVYTVSNNADDALDSDADPLTGQTAVVTLVALTPDNRTVDVGVYRECENVIDGGSIAGNETGCGPLFDPGLIVGTGAPTGGSGAYEYLWLQSAIPVYNGPTDPNWSPAPGGTAVDYDPAAITQNTYYIRCVRRNGCTEYLGESNIVEKLVTDPPLAFVQDGPNGICPDDATSFTAAIAGGGSTYQWNFGPDANLATVNTRVVSGISFNSVGTHTVSLTVSRFGCSQTTTYTFEVLSCLQVFPNPAVELVEVRLHRPAEPQTTLEVRNALGEIVLTQRVPAFIDATQVDLTGLMDGGYWIVVREPGRPVQRVRVMKVE